LSSREAKVAKQSVKSSVIIAAGNISSMVFLLVGSLVVARLLGPQEYGIYSLALALPLFLQILVGFGVNTAIYRFTAYHLAKGEVATARRMTMSAILFYLLSGSGLTVLSIGLAGSISSTLLNRPFLTLYVEAASILILGQALFNFLTPAFVGWHAPHQDAFWTIMQAVIKLAVSVFLILLGFGVLGALIGYVLASLLAGIFGIVVLYFTKLRRNVKVNNNETGALSTWNFGNFKSDVKIMVKYGMPSYIGNIILVISQQPVMAIILSYIATNAIIGYYAAAGGITQGIVSISSALTPAFYTAFASLDGMGSNLGTAFKYGIKYVSYFLMPLIFFIFSTSSILIQILYGRAYLPSTPFLEILTLGYLPYAFGYSVLIPFVNGTGNTKLNMVMDIIEAVSTIVPALVLIFLLKLGVYGLLFSIALSNVGPTIFGLYSSQKYLHAEVDYIALVKTFLVSAACFLCIYAFISLGLNGLSYFIAFPVELIVFLALYLTLMPLSRAIKKEDIDRLRISTRGIKGVSVPLNFILRYESRIIEMMKKD
jgi:O-antigen/teichoic acid export membrane protein